MPTSRQIAYARRLRIRQPETMNRFELSQAINEACMAKQQRKRRNEPITQARKAAYSLGIIGALSSLDALNSAIQRRLRRRFEREMAEKGQGAASQSALIIALCGRLMSRLVLGDGDFLGGVASFATQKEKGDRKMARYAAKVDRNQPKIVSALRDAGCDVFITSNVAGGFPDIVVGRGGQTYLLEIKAKKGKLTRHQVEFFESWRGHACVVRTVDDALRAVGLL